MRRVGFPDPRRVLEAIGRPLGDDPPSPGLVFWNGDRFEFAHRWLGAAGLSERATARLAGYRDLPAAASFGKVVSVGICEHVGLPSLPGYFRIAAGALQPGGMLLNHGIVATDPEGRGRRPIGGDFIDRSVPVTGGRAAADGGEA